MGKFGAVNELCVKQPMSRARKLVTDACLRAVRVLQRQADPPTYERRALGQLLPHTSRAMYGQLQNSNTGMQRSHRPVVSPGPTYKRGTLCLLRQHGRCCPQR